MNYYEIYPGGVISGELVIKTNANPDENGNVLLTEEEYQAGFCGVGMRSKRGSSNYFEGYDVTTLGDRAVLHRVPFDDESVQRQLRKE